MTAEIYPGVFCVGPALFLERTRTLILADLHLGAESALVGQGVLLPRTQKRELFKTINEVLTKATPERILLNGDIKHGFSGIHDEEWRDVLELLDVLCAHASVTVIKGNHDAMLCPILRKRHVLATASTLIDGWLVTHGDQEPEEAMLAQAHGVIIGHEHPSLLLDDGVRKEKYKCFLTGTYKGKRLVVLPSTYPLVEGSDVLREQALGPVLEAATGLQAYVVEGMDVLYFGLLDGINDKI